MKSPRHLWSGDWRAESEAARQEREREREAAPSADPTLEYPAASAASTDGSHHAFFRGALGGITAAVVIAAIVGVVLLTGVIHTGSNSSSKHVAALPALPAAPIRQLKGETRAAAIYAAASPAVVSIRTSEGSGTGFLIDRNGTLVTNAHVVGTDPTVTVRFGDTGANMTGTVIGRDPSSDLAVVRIPTGGIPSNAAPLHLADSRDVRVGDAVVAIGNPFGLDRTETTGIVSGLGRSIQAPNGFEIDDAIQTDAAINPGNSGGPLLNSNDEVIGVNSQIETGGAGSDGNVGIGFAVSANSVRQVVPVLERGDKVAHPWLGVETQDTTNGTNGASVASVVPNSPAAAAGLQANDVITRIDSTPVESSEGVAQAINGDKVGQKITVQVDRGGQDVSVTVTLGDRPAQAPSP